MRRITTMGTKSIFVDIDGTIADIQHRVHHLTDTKDGSVHKDWDAFYAEIEDDDPIQPTIDIVNALWKKGYHIILITGRDAERRALTIAWLLEHKVHWDVLLMRPIGDHRPDVKIKREWLKKMRDGELILCGIEVPEIVIEDRKKVIDMWREEGLIALHCDVGEF
jgi:predicted secreted acid phosphatase